MTQRFRLFKNGNSNGKRDDNPVGGRISPNHTHGFNVSIPMLNPKSSSQLTYGKSTPIYISPFINHLIEEEMPWISERFFEF